MTIAKPACARAGCTNHLVGRQKKYCSNECRAISMQDSKRQLAESVALAEVREAVAPVVREHLTEQVMRELGALVDLVPKALSTLREGLEAEQPAGEGHVMPDYAERRQAATTILRYTVGNDSIKPAGAEHTPPQFNINFGMPQQGDSVADADGSVLELDPGPTGGALILRTCNECGESKPPDSFVGNSNRCEDCHAKVMSGIRARFPDMLPS